MGVDQISKWKEGNQLLEKLGMKDFSTTLPKLEKFISNISTNGLDLLSKMLHLNPKKRISLKKVLEHPFFIEDSFLTPEKSIGEHYK